MTRALVRAAFVAPFVLFVAVYLSTAGHGFLKDDFGWILQSRVRSLDDFTGIFTTSNGFYRPVVSLTFTVNEWVFGTHPFGYGATNVVLALLCAASIFFLARALRLPRGGATFAAAVWLLNFQGIRMAVLWNSGRTTLLVTLAATSAAIALVRGRTALAGVCLIAALLSKEEAVLLPLTLLAWLLVLEPPGDARRRRIVTWSIVGAVTLALYFWIRASTGAMTPWDAPWYYRPTFDPGKVFQNVRMYADRIATFPVLAALLAWVALGFVRPVIDSRVRAIFVCGAVWVIGGLGTTIFLPVRSDLYACLPSVGVCLASGALAVAMWNASTAPHRTRALVGSLIMLMVLSPVYVLRTRRWSHLADFSYAALADLNRLTSSLPSGSTVVVQDDRTTRNNLANAFGAVFNDAFLLTAGRRMNLWIEPALGDLDLAGLAPPCATCVDLRLKVANGRVVPDPR